MKYGVATKTWQHWGVCTYVALSYKIRFWLTTKAKGYQEFWTYLEVKNVLTCEKTTTITLNNAELCMPVVRVFQNLTRDSKAYTIICLLYWIKTLPLRNTCIIIMLVRNANTRFCLKFLKMWQKILTWKIVKSNNVLLLHYSAL